ILVMAGLTGCVETDSPTAPLLEQRVFTALGGLEVGEALSLTGEAAATVLLGASSAAGDFVIIPFHASLAQGSRLVVEIAGRSVGSPASSTAPAPSSGPLAFAGSVASWDLHEARQERFRSAVQPLLDSRLRTSEASLQRAL